MSNLINYLSYPIKKLFSTPEFKAAARRLGLNPVSPVSYPFMWYPEAALTTAGPKFRYSDGTQLISYHIKGIHSISGSGNGIDLYLCSINVPEGFFDIFPGSITGTFQSGGGGDIITTPLADGGVVEINGVHVPISNFAMNLFSYGGNPEPDGSHNYALVITATIDNPENYSITGLVSYDFEFLLSDFVPAPTIFQD